MRLLFMSAVLAALLLPAVPLHAQAMRSALPVDTWAFGASGEMAWSQDRGGHTHADAGLDASVERRVRRVGKRDVLGIRVQVARGTGNGHEDGFAYTRLLAGLIRHACLKEHECYGNEGYAVYFVGGGGFYLLTRSDADRAILTGGASLREAQLAKPSVFGGIGVDRTLGTRRATLRTELRVYSIGSDVQAAVAVGVQLHLR